MFYSVCYLYSFYLKECKNTKFFLFFFFLGSLAILGGLDG